MGQEEPSRGALRLNSGVTPRRGGDPAQLLHPRSDRGKVVGGAGSGALAAQLLHAGPDRSKVVGGAGSGHVSSVSCGPDNDQPTAAAGSVELGSLSRTLPMRGLILALA
jgi:hypothetical protein